MEIKINGGKVKKTIFPPNFVCVIRTTAACHTVKFIGFFLFHFLANFQTQTSRHMFPLFTHVMLRDTHSEPGLAVVWWVRIWRSSQVFEYIHLAFVRTISPASLQPVSLQNRRISGASAIYEGAREVRARTRSATRALVSRWPRLSACFAG